MVVPSIVPPLISTPVKLHVAVTSCAVSRNAPDSTRTWSRNTEHAPAEPCDTRIIMLQSVALAGTSNTPTKSCQLVDVTPPLSAMGPLKIKPPTEASNSSSMPTSVVLALWRKRTIKRSPGDTLNVSVWADVVCVMSFMSIRRHTSPWSESAEPASEWE